MALLAPTPKVSVSTIAIEKPGFLRSERIAYFIFWKNNDMGHRIVDTHAAFSLNSSDILR